MVYTPCGGRGASYILPRIAGYPRAGGGGAKRRVRASYAFVVENFRFLMILS